MFKTFLANSCQQTKYIFLPALLQIHNFLPKFKLCIHCVALKLTGSQKALKKHLQKASNLLKMNMSLKVINILQY